MAKGTNRKAVEWANCYGDAAYFANNYGIIDAPQGNGFATLPFHLWPAQIQLMWRLMTDRMVIILKARQLGISWLACSYALWLCFFQDGKVALLFSRGQLEADELARRVLSLYQRLPEWMRKAGPSLVTQNTSELEWSNGSRIISLPATQDAGRTFTASLVVIDECAFLKWPDKLYTSLKSTIDDGGQLIILSTANGIGNFFHELWEKATGQLNDFKAYFLPWWSRPGRDKEWRARIEQEAASPLLAQQEYPATPEEAFVSTHVERFLDSILWWDKCIENAVPLDSYTPLVLALDAAVSGDSFGLIGVTRHPERNDDISVRLIRKWTPSRGVEISYAPIEQEVREICSQYNVVCLTYDPYQLHYLTGRLAADGVVWCDKFDQGAARLIADNQLLQLIKARRIVHDGNAELRQHLDNADRKLGETKEQLRIVKRRDELKIDLAVALSMAASKCLALNL